MITADKIHLLLMLLLSAASALSVSFSKRYISTKWKLTGIVPLIVSTAIITVNGFEKCMLGVYIAALLPLLVFVKDTDRVKLASSAAAAVCCLLSVPACMTVKGYRSPDYTGDFKKMFDTMRRHYVLSEYKEIDWDALYDEYLPQFRSADRNSCAVENNAAWLGFCAEFHDEHVSYMPENVYNEDQMLAEMVRIYDYLGAHDYGFGMMPLSDGTAAAVDVDPGSMAYAQGIRNGTVITLWDGMDVFEAGESSPLMAVRNCSEKDNKRFFTPLIASITGGDTVSVTFIAEDGSEREVSLSPAGSGYERFDSVRSRVERGIEVPNFGWCSIDDRTAAFRVKSMIYDSDSSASEDYTDMKIIVRRKIEELQSAGVENLIIDLRSNSGGSGQLVLALGELFAPEGEHYYSTGGLWDDEAHRYVYNEDTHTYGTGKSNYFYGTGLWKGNIIILVNSQSVSAADHFTKIMKDFDNVTVMGFTKSNGSAQGTTAAAGKNGTLIFSGALMLNEDGTPFIDSGTDGVSGSEVDILVPFDQAAIKAIFEDDEDYLLTKALEHFEALE